MKRVDTTPHRTAGALGRKHLGVPTIASPAGGRSICPAALRWWPAAACVLLCVVVLPLHAESPGTGQCHLLDGTTFPASFAGIDADGGFLFQTDSGRRSVPCKEMVRWGRLLELRAGPAVLLGDGSLLAARSVKLNGDNLLLDCQSLGRLELPVASAAGIVFQLPGEMLARDRLLDRIAATEGDADLLLLTNGDEITGRFESIEPFSLRFVSPVGPLQVETARLRGLVFNPALRNAVDIPPQYTMVGTRDGTRVVARSIAPHARGVRLELPGAVQAVVSVAQIAWMQSFGDPLVYLSDLEPAGYRHVPFLETSWPYRLDRNVLGGHLRSGGQLYLKGIGVHSASRVRFSLAGRYRLFQAELGIDDVANGGGSVQFRVFVDGTEKYASEVIRGGRPPVPVSVEIAGGKQLDLVVDFADRGDVLDRADWLDARLVR